jgi:hypothetical protein
MADSAFFSFIFIVKKRRKTGWSSAECLTRIGKKRREPVGSNA